MPRPSLSIKPADSGQEPIRSGADSLRFAVSRKRSNGEWPLLRTSSQGPDDSVEHDRLPGEIAVENGGSQFGP